jgi:hypothetical protein
MAKQGRAGKLRSLIPTWKDIKDAALPTLRGSATGSVCGIMPGSGPTIASFIAYAPERRVSRTPERFGKGAIEGVAAPEAANNGRRPRRHSFPCSASPGRDPGRRYADSPSAGPSVAASSQGDRAACQRASRVARRRSAVQAGVQERARGGTARFS